MTLNNLTKEGTQGMQRINGFIEEGVVAVPWLLGAREDHASADPSWLEDQMEKISMSVAPKALEGR